MVLQLGVDLFSKAYALGLVGVLFVFLFCAFLFVLFPTILVVQEWLEGTVICISLPGVEG